VIEYAIFLHGLAQQWGRERKEIWHKGSLGDEDDARTKYKHSVEKACNTTLAYDK